MGESRRLKNAEVRQREGRRLGQSGGVPGGGTKECGVRLRGWLLFPEPTFCVGTTRFSSFHTALETMHYLVNIQTSIDKTIPHLPARSQNHAADIALYCLMQWMQRY